MVDVEGGGCGNKATAPVKAGSTGRKWQGGVQLAIQGGVAVSIKGVGYTRDELGVWVEIGVLVQLRFDLFSWSHGHDADWGSFGVLPVVTRCSKVELFAELAQKFGY
ncbi:hypothetical protein Droror1_Dr00025144 [Drosera rotundifolia]